MKKIVVSASLAMVAMNSFAAIKVPFEVKPVENVDEELTKRVDAALQKRESSETVADLYTALMRSMSKDGKTLAEQAMPSSFDGSVQVAWNEDHSVIGATICYGNCYTNCHGACHSACHGACHGSRGWR